MRRAKTVLGRLTSRMRDCEEVRMLMSEYVDDELDAAGVERVESHVGRCKRCRLVLANLRVTVARLGGLAAAAPLEPPSREATERITSAWRHADRG